MYTRAPKESASTSRTSTPKKSNASETSHSFSIQPHPEIHLAPVSEAPSYSRNAADLLSENIMRSLSSPEPEPEAAPAALEVTPTPQLPTPSIQPKEISIQRQCTDCAEEQQEQSENEEKSFDEIASIQTKLTIGAPGDQYEQEADKMAAQVMSMSVTPQVQRFPETENPVQMRSLAQSITPVVQTQVNEQVQMQQLIQRAFQPTHTQASGDLESRLSGSKGGGSPLSQEVRSFMEPRFGADFSQVRVHTDSEAVQMNQELGAQAFTHGSDLYFGAGKSPGNNELTAHELTHVVQQNAVEFIRQYIQRDEEASHPQICQADCHSGSEASIFSSFDIPPLTESQQQGLAYFAQDLEQQRIGEYLSQHWLGRDRLISLRFQFGNLDPLIIPSVFIRSNFESHHLASPDQVYGDLFNCCDYFVFKLREVSAVAQNYRGFFQSWIGQWMNFENTLNDLPQTVEGVRQGISLFRTKHSEMFTQIWDSFGNYIQVQGRSDTRPTAEGEAASLTPEQIEQLREAASQYDYTLVNGYYTQLNTWLDNVPSLSFIKTSIERIDTLVETVYGEERPRIPGNLLNRLKLLSKIISIQDYIDRIMFYDGLHNRVQGSENTARFNGFLRYWNEYGWTDLISFYNALSTEQPINLTEAAYLSLDQPEKVNIALRIGRVLEMDNRIQLEVMAAGIQETMSGFLSVTWNAIDTVILSRIPGWVLISLAVNLTSDGIQTILNAFSAE